MNEGMPKTELDLMGEPRYELDRSMHRRNWLMIWLMEDLGIDVEELSKLTGLRDKHIYRFLLQENTEHITKNCKTICRALKCQPRDIGWGMKFEAGRCPGRVDITNLKKLLRVYVNGLNDVARYLKNLEEDVFRIERNFYK